MSRAPHAPRRLRTTAPPTSDARTAPGSPPTSRARPGRGTTVPPTLSTRPRRGAAAARRTAGALSRLHAPPQVVWGGIAVLAGALSVLEVALHPAREGPLGWSLLAAAAYSLPLALVRTRPLVVAVVMLGSVAATSALLTPADQLVTPMLDVLALAYGVGAYAMSRHAAWTGPLLLAAGMVANVALLTSPSVAGYVFPTCLVLLAWLAARVVGAYRALAAERRDAASRAHEARSAELRLAAADERRGIAREMHDVIARSTTAMVVEAGGARRILDRDPGRAVTAAVDIERTGREALAEMRHLLRLLHPDERHAALVPQPRLAHVSALVDRARAAGVPATLCEEGERRPLPAGLDLAAYRIVQDALAIAVKQAGPTEVLVCWRDSELELVVRDAGPRGAVAATEHDGAHDLVGMRERARLYGGELTMSRPAHGGWAVRARLPLAAPGAVPA